TEEGCARISAGRFAAARGVYQALYNFVSAQKDKHIPSALAEPVLRAALALRGS
ncbi:MAG: hypothetical protein HYZ27_01430, partial [Deltaproteobacteria bacterium]|nr:hypothetical protein [Deltaproteobacteria bacterium]